MKKEKIMEAGLNIESLFMEKLLLYQDLLDALEQEKRSIIDIDVDGLWKISERKKEIARKIESVRSRILKQLDDASIDTQLEIAGFHSSKILSVLSGDAREKIGSIRLSLSASKREVQLRLEENRRYVGEYLTILDDLIGTIAGAGRPKPVYERNRCSVKPKASLFLHREV
jgi:hypothetical protein